MGLTLQGIAANFKTKKADIFAFHMRIETPTHLGISDFETAISSENNENYLFVTEVRNGTIVTAGLDVPIDNISLEKLSSNGQVLRFMIEETSMMFAYELYKNGELIRSVQNHQDENIYEEGELLEIEASESDCSQIIFRLIELVTGDSIDTLDLNTPVEKYEIG